MRVYIVPDVHGRPFWRQILDINVGPEDKVIFLGDYSDPYSSEGLTHEDALTELADIVEFKKQSPDQVTLLWGNHDFHYFNGEYACSRYAYNMQHHYGEFYVKQKELFEPFKLLKINDINYLFIHAGVTRGWVEQNGFESIFDSMHPDEALQTTFDQFPSTWLQWSRYRGGWQQFGGPMTADLREHGPMGAWSNVQQVIGHTQLNVDGYYNGNIHCLDCRKVFVLENGEFKVL